MHFLTFSVFTCWNIPTRPDSSCTIGDLISVPARLFLIGNNQAVLHEAGGERASGGCARPRRSVLCGVRLHGGAVCESYFFAGRRPGQSH
jgi:hypothetical protein